MISALENLCGPGKSLRKEPADAKEFAGLTRSGKERLADAQNSDVSMAVRFDLAYNASHALSQSGGVAPPRISCHEPLYRIPGIAAYARSRYSSMGRAGKVP